MKLRPLLTEALEVFAAAHDEKDGKFIGIVGPFPSDRAAKIYFDRHIPGVKYEIERPIRPEEFEKAFK